MNKFKDFIEIDKKFQNSINLQLDIDNLSKLNSYIPTHSSILVLDGFLNNVLSDRDKANILIGPYGKGKSHLLLVLLALLNDGKGDRTKKTINKIEKVSKETAEKIKSLSTTGIWFILISATSAEKSPVSIWIRSRYLVALKNGMPMAVAITIRTMRIPMKPKPIFKGLARDRRGVTSSGSRSSVSNWI